MRVGRKAKVGGFEGSAERPFNKKTEKERVLVQKIQKKKEQKTKLTVLKLL